jgi:hypothetical protein
VVYVYNPTIAPQHFRSYVFQPKTYSVISEEAAEALAKTSIPVQVEGCPDFPDLWARYPVVR